MNVGLPGTGIGGLFYIIGALYAPVGALVRPAERGRRLSRALRNAALALGILGALWITGWGLGLLVTSGAWVMGQGRGVGAATTEVVSLVRWVAVLGTTGLLALVLLTVQVLRIVVPRPAATRAGPREVAIAGMPFATGEPASPVWNSTDGESLRETAGARS